MVIREDYMEQAQKLHRRAPVVDAHLDLVTEVYRRRLAGEKGILKKYYKDEFQKSGVNLVLASLFLGEDELRDSREGCAFPKGAVLKKSMEMLAAFYEDMEEAKGRIQLVTDRESLRRITAKRSLSRHHKVGVLLYLEGLDMLEGEPALFLCYGGAGSGAYLEPAGTCKRICPGVFCRRRVIRGMRFCLPEIFDRRK